MFNLGFSEMLIIGVLALLLIGPKQLPEVAKVLGRMMSEFKKAAADLSGGLLDVKEDLKKPVQEGMGAIAEIKNAIHETKDHLRNQILEDEHSVSEKSTDENSVGENITDEHSITVDLEELLKKNREQNQLDENDDKKSTT